RVNSLLSEKKRIDQLAAQNPSFAGDLMRDELVKCDTLVRSFIDMALTCARLERYLDSVDVRDLDRERASLETRCKSMKDDSSPAAAIAKKNLDVILKRIDRIQEIRQYLGVAHGQLDLIENTF